MGFNCGIVGLPNVGKSTLFNALTNTISAEAANYPFCTIEPNMGRVGVPDDRLYQLADLAESQKIIPTQLEFVDIAGLVKGASKGEGLGNQFLGNIRATDAIIHVLRCFEDEDITHVEGSVDPLRDIDIIETELLLADLASIEKQKDQLEKRARAKDKLSGELIQVLDPVYQCLSEGKPARMAEYPSEFEHHMRHLQLLTNKPILYVCNVDEDSAADGNEYSDKVVAYAKAHNAHAVVISSRIESEIAQLDTEEKADFIESLGLSESGLSKIIKSGYDLLNLTTFFTVGPKEARAWTICKGDTAFDAAGKIHTDFQKGFIFAETVAFADYIECKTEQATKEQGKMRLEGKDYVVHDGDVFHFRFNV